MQQAHPPQQQQQQQQRAAAPHPHAAAPVMPAVYGGHASSYVPTADELTQAEKYARFAVSAVQFEDAPAAIKNLILALRVLTGEGAPAKPVNKPV